MTTATRNQATLPQDTVSDRRYIVQEAQTLFRQNQQLTDQESIKKCLAECETRIEIGLYYRNPYPRLIYLLIMGLATQKGRKLKAQQRMRKQASQFTYSYMRTADTTADTR
uniref:Complex 1 LYR protein domain-containing protein n=1 Tax=Oncorhynchus tshawytscha TaxID=74940 RepID=A0A8C8JV87_ONCTS